MNPSPAYPLRPQKSPAPMPYGVVMATGGAAQIAALGGWPSVAVALTGIAILQAILIPACAWWMQGRLRMPVWRFGLFTIPLGLAVIAADLSIPAPAAGSVLLALAWLATLALGSWRLALAFRPASLAERVDGTWFLAPAALLGDAAATAMAAGADSGWTRLAVATCLAGVAGYAMVIAASALRLFRHGWKGSPLAPWWIAAGCGGLAAATLGEVTDVAANPLLRPWLIGLLAASWAVGTVLLAAVLIGCAVYAARRPHGPRMHVWTPVFSMAVYAAGTRQFDKLCAAHSIAPFLAITMLATLALWVAHHLLYLRHQFAADWRIVRRHPGSRDR